MPKPVTIPKLEITPDAVKWFNHYLTAAHDDVVSEKVTITPERASILLTRNPDNRNLREAKVAQLSSDLRTGKFKFNGESVIISRDGLLNDGQHRLFACIKTGIPFETILVVGTERTSRYSIDTGSAKSAGDHLHFQGVHNPNTAAAIARYVLTWEIEGNFFARRGRISAQQQIDRVLSDPLLREIAGWVDSKRARMRDLIKGALAGAIFYELAAKAPAEAKLFMDNLCVGAGLDAQSPIFLLREKLRQSGRMSESQKIEVVVRAWNHWCQGPTTTLSRLQIIGNVPAIQSPQWHVAHNADEHVAHNADEPHMLPPPAADDLIEVKVKAKPKAKKTEAEKV